MIIGIDGWDAAGKGGLIERIVGRPRAEIGPCLAHRRADAGTNRAGTISGASGSGCPRPANWAIFDRTWYGRVLVERIEGFCDKEAWKRAYREINEFERELVDDGVRIVKLLVHVSEEEQKKRMIKRLEDPHKRYKIGPEDFRNIAKRKQYLEAYDDMLEKTDTEHAPWHVIATDDKKQARLDGLQDHRRRAGPRRRRSPSSELDPGDRRAGAQAVGLEADKDDEVNSDSRAFSPAGGSSPAPSSA